MKGKVASLLITNHCALHRLVSIIWVLSSALGAHQATSLLMHTPGVMTWKCRNIFPLPTTNKQSMLYYYGWTHMQNKTAATVER